MIITRAPFRISLFGGSTDYKCFYKEHGSFIIGTTINKYIYTSFRFRPSMVSDHNVIAYSSLETPEQIKDIQHPLIRETLKYCNIQDTVDLHFFADIPSRTGLGGSSAFCVSLLKALKPDANKKYISKAAIEIERNILAESGGIQDQIWSSYGGFNMIEINTDGNFVVKPMPLSEEFLFQLSKSMILIYTNTQRHTNTIAQSYENIDKSDLLSIAYESRRLFTQEDIKSIGKLLLESWKVKKSISNLITTSYIDEMSNTLLLNGLYGLKLLGSGGSGFILGIGSPTSIVKAKEIFKSLVLDFDFENEGCTPVFKNNGY